MAQNKKQNKGLTQIGYQGGTTGPCAGSAGRGRTTAGNCSQPGECVCPQCGTKATHERGVPCLQTKCPQCGMAMTRA
jgi:hypothetical protein